MLKIEDGSIVAGAQSYASVHDLRTYAGLRGVNVSANDLDAEAYLIQAMDFIEGQRARFKGDKTSATQPLQWPRSGAYVDLMQLGPNEIPRELVYAQMALAIDVSNGHDLSPTYSANERGAVIKEKLDGMEVQYSDTKKGRLNVPAFAKAEALLAVLYKRNGLYSIPITRA